MSHVMAELKARSVSWLVLLAVGFAALAVGAVLGNNASLGSKNLTVLEGRALLHNTENWMTSFDTDDPADQLVFLANAVAWSDEDSSGGDHPPCLKQGREVPVRVGYTRVSFPDGGSRSIVAWVECLG